MKAGLTRPAPSRQQSRRRGSAAPVQGRFFVESSKVFFSRVDTPEKPLRFERSPSWFEQNLDGFGLAPSLWRTA
jgi:hypothetical protein